MIPPLKMTDRVQKAITWMEELRINQLPVIEKSRFKGLISEELVFQKNNLDQLVSEFDLFGQDCFVNENQHLYEVIKLSSDFSVEVIAVINDEGEFTGVITVQDTLASFAQSAAIQSPGGILVLSLNQRDYSMTEISRLVESNDAKILGSSISLDPMDVNMLKLTLKTNKTDLSHIIATFERFGYKIIAKFIKTEMETNEKERLDILLKYLDI
jgi:hypothetical protein